MRSGNPPKSLRQSTRRLLQDPVPAQASSPGSVPAPEAITEPIRLDELASTTEEGGRLDAALDALTNAIGAVAGYPGQRFERDLIEALLLPRLTAMVEDLHLLSMDAETDTARRRITDSLRAIATASAVLSKHGHTELAAHLDAVCVRVTAAVSPP